MNFKSYVQIKESAGFIDLGSFTAFVFAKLQDKLREKSSINSGDKVTIDLGSDFGLDIKFYKRLSNAAKEAIGSNPELDKAVKAIYFPATGEDNPRIEIYTNSAKKGQYYYRDKGFEDFMNHTLPKYIKDQLAGEIATLYRDIVSALVAANHRAANPTAHMPI